MVVAPGVAIDRDVPLPPPRGGGRAGRSGRCRRWHWDRLDIGDSFLSPNLRVVQMALHWALTNGRTFTSRKSRAREYRVWRTA